MRHRNPKAMRENALEAIPQAKQNPLSVNQIFTRQAIPRLPRNEIKYLIEAQASAGLLEVFTIGYMQYYRRRSSTTSLAIASQADSAYTGDQRKDFSLDAKLDWFLQTLSPLRHGKLVKLWMDNPRFSTLKNFRGKKQLLVILTPGVAFGQQQSLVLVSVVGAGSAIVNSNTPNNISGLVLAGMKPQLARELTSRLHKALSVHPGPDPINSTE